MKERKFYICKHCGNIITFIKESGVKVVCCGDQMTEIIPGSIDASLEKHVPEISVNGSTVTVNIGSVDHPMVEEHYIEWIMLQTEQGNQRKELVPGDAPSVVFALTEDDKPVCAYAYCNLHGLWKKDI